MKQRGALSALRPKAHNIRWEHKERGDFGVWRHTLSHARKQSAGILSVATSFTYNNSAVATAATDKNKRKNSKHERIKF